MSPLIGFDDRNERRRKYARLPIVVLCDICDPVTGKILGKGCVLNFSRGGLSVASPATIAWDTPVNLTVEGLDQEGFLSAKVVNVRPVTDELFSYGLEFLGLNALQRIQVERKFKKLFQARLS